MINSYICYVIIHDEVFFISKSNDVFELGKEPAFMFSEDNKSYYHEVFGKLFPYELHYQKVDWLPELELNTLIANTYQLLVTHLGKNRLDEFFTLLLQFCSNINIPKPFIEFVINKMKNVEKEEIKSTALTSSLEN